MSDLKLYTPNEVAEILKLSRQTVYNYITAGKLRSVQLGREHRISEEDLKEFLKTGTKRSKK